MGGVAGLEMPRNEYGLLDLSEIKQRVDTLAAKIGAPESSVPSCGQNWADDHPYYEVSWAYHLVERQRGEEHRRWTTDLDEALYWGFETVTFNMASDYQVRHRVEGEDSRWMLFAYQLQLLNILDPAWPEKRVAKLPVRFRKAFAADAGLVDRILAGEFPKNYTV